MNIDNIRIAIIGLGYVGLPLAVEFGKTRPVIGYDINKNRINELNDNLDLTYEVETKELREAKNLSFTSDQNLLNECNFFIVTVPTPIDVNKNPNLTPVLEASELVGGVIKKGDIVVYESTVYPGVTEDECVPILEKESNLKFNKDFYVGYSPERINPGDKNHRLPNIVKLVSGSSPEATEIINSLYSEIITAGTYVTSSIKVAEAAKVIENTQRDLNIALINELSKIFNIMDIDTESVLKAAGTKWNFLDFKPGLVGGHCIGVDPYYLTYKAQSIGYNPEIILAGRKTNDEMSKYISKNLIHAMSNKNIDTSEAKILIMGFTFKENCPDIRNTKVQDIYDELVNHDFKVDIFDPWVRKEDIEKAKNLNFIDTLENHTYSAVIIAVAHQQFKEMNIKEINKLCKPDRIIYDLKYILEVQDADLRL